MNTKRSTAQSSKQQSTSAITKEKPHLLKLAEGHLQNFLGWFFHLFLRTFNELQDAILAITSLRRLFVFALAPKCQSIVEAHIKDGASL